jgi:hypothetical protein
MGLHQPDALSRGLSLGDLDHLVRNRVGKKDDHVRIPYQTFKIGLGLRENLYLASIFLADVPVTAYHTVVSAYYYHIHNVTLQ